MLYSDPSIMAEMLGKGRWLELKRIEYADPHGHTRVRPGLERVTSISRI